MTSFAAGAARADPLPPFSIMIAIAILGLSLGA